MMRAGSREKSSSRTAATSKRLQEDNTISAYPRETNRPSRRWVDRWMPNLIHCNILDRGGHFAAWEQPGLHAKEIRDCFAKVC